jgi:hypothetical protein
MNLTNINNVLNEIEFELKKIYKNIKKNKNTINDEERKNYLKKIKILKKKLKKLLENNH